jgi:hypothetical protein
MCGFCHKWSLKPDDLWLNLSTSIHYS